MYYPARAVSHAGRGEVKAGGDPGPWLPPAAETFIPNVTSHACSTTGKGAAPRQMTGIVAAGTCMGNAT